MNFELTKSCDEIAIVHFQIVQGQDWENADFPRSYTTTGAVGSFVLHCHFLGGTFLYKRP